MLFVTWMNHVKNGWCRQITFVLMNSCNSCFCCLFVFCYITQQGNNRFSSYFTALFDQRITEGSNVTIQCENEGRVTWSKRVDGKREIILKAPSEEDPVQSKPGPEPRYSLLTNLSLVIQEALVSDSGIYFCNITPVVNLTVTALNGGCLKLSSVLSLCFC